MSALKIHDSKITDVPDAFRNSVAMPDTASARASHREMLRWSQNVGYQKVGWATGRDTSWVCRYLNGEGVASFNEWMAMLDAIGCRIVHEGDSSDVDAELVGKLSAALGRLSEHDQTNASKLTVSVDRDVYASMVNLAQRALSMMKER